MLSFHTVQAQLSRFAAQGNFVALMQAAFGESLDLLKLSQLRQQWLTGKFFYPASVPNSLPRATRH